MNEDLILEEEKVSFNTAKLAKEKGFLLFCHWYYYPSAFTKNDEPRLIADGLLDPNKTFYDGIIDDIYCGVSQSIHNHIDGFYSAPTQSLLQHWLRKVHNIHIEINRTYEKGNYIYEFFIDKNNQSFGFKSYEEALEEGLIVALKQIK